MMTTQNFSKITAWQTALIDAITDPAELFQLLQLDSHLLDAAKAAAKLFPFKVPREFVSRMQKGNIDDPLLRQILPLHAELIETPGYTNDPLGEAAVNPVPGLLHKYKSRVLLTLVGTCAINCRYCFRRHFPYADNNPGSAGWEKAVEYIAKDPSITEVILSGGDPLVANDKILFQLSEKLNAIPHIKRLRIHTRIPIILPERITPEFIQWISQLKQKLIIVTHCNHAQEINTAVKIAIAALHQAGATLLNQAVLLKGINDDVQTLAELNEGLFDIHIHPYYLHCLDKVQGAAHFDIEKERAQSLHKELSERLSGYLVPRLVYEAAGALSKLSLT